MELQVPTRLIQWVDEKRGDLSRQAFILDCVSFLSMLEKLDVTATSGSDRLVQRQGQSKT